MRTLAAPLRTLDEACGVLVRSLEEETRGTDSRRDRAGPLDWESGLTANSDSINQTVGEIGGWKDIVTRYQAPCLASLVATRQPDRFLWCSGTSSISACTCLVDHTAVAILAGG
jgi:hypothetical protein